MIRQLTFIILLTVIWSCNQSADKKEKLILGLFTKAKVGNNFWLEGSEFRDTVKRRDNEKI